jgi:AraC-like DNA-binding protein
MPGPLTVRTPSALASWARTVLEAARTAGVDTDTLLVSAGLEPALLDDPDARIPVPVMARLWRRAAEQAGDPALGLRVSKLVHFTTFHALGYSVVASSSLGEAIDRIVRYNQVVSDAARLHVERTPERHTRVVLALAKGYERGGAEIIDASMSLLVRTLRYLGGEAFRLNSVELSRPAPSDVAPYERFFRCPVSFTGHNVLCFDESTLDFRITSGNPALARHNDGATRDYLARIAEGDLRDRVRATITQQLERDITPHTVAKALGLSLRSMQRGLKELGASYEALLRDTRRELACAHLREGKLSVAEIAFLLGYDSLGAFTQAFRRWLGVSPSEFVKQSARAKG